MPRKQRQRPAAGIEVIYENEHYSAIALDVPRFADPVIHIYSKPHHDLLFHAFSLGLFFKCKRCQQEHLLRWHEYNRHLQAASPPYDVLCTQVEDIWLALPDHPIPPHIKAYKIFTITTDLVDLLLSIASYLTNKAEIVS